jgi:serine/threonine protein kinase
VRLTYVEDQARWGLWARPGSSLAGRYELEAPLAAHTPGTFWQARRANAAARTEKVTVQLLDAGLVEDLGSRQAFLEEARAAATIEHAHVARVLDYGVHAERGQEVPFLVLEYLLGETLEDRLAAEPRLPQAELARLVTEAARGLHALHGWGLVHRRLDPAHWFLAREPGSKRSRTKLLFAIDDVLGDHLSLVSKLSHQLGHAHRGKPEADHEGRRRPAAREYQSPEQLLGHDGVDERSDLWSLAVIAFEALTGTAAFSGNTTGERLVQICSGEPNAIPADAALPAGFADWFQKGVHKLPAQRFASARELADALRRVLDPLAARRS